MITVRRTVLVLAISIVAALCALPRRGRSRRGAAQPELGPLSPAFVEALHDPMVALGLGRVPSPVEVHVDAATEAAVGRAAQPSSYDLRDQGRVTPVKDQGNYSTCWAFGNLAALESKAHAGRSRARLQRGQPGGAQRLRLQSAGLALQPGRLRLHGRGVLRPLGRAR